MTLVANLPPESTRSAFLVLNLPLVSLIPVVHLDLPISPRIFEKTRNDPNVIFRAWGKMIFEINLKQKSCDTVPLKGLSHEIDFKNVDQNLKNLA